MSWGLVLESIPSFELRHQRAHAVNGTIDLQGGNKTFPLSGVEQNDDPTFFNHYPEPEPKRGARSGPDANLRMAQYLHRGRPDGRSEGT